MFLTIQKQKLMKLLNAVHPVVGETKTIKITECVKITALEGKCIIAATDLTTTIKAYKEADIKEEGELCVSGKALHDIVHSLPDVNITLRRVGNRFNIGTGKSQFGLNVMDADAFPNVTNYSKMEFQPFPEEFFEKTKSILYAVSKDETRPALNAICAKPNQIAATDGHRLAMFSLDIPIDREILIESESVSRIQKALSYGDGEKVGFFLATNEIHFLKGEVAISARLLSTQYPDVNAVIPKTTAVTVDVKLQELKDAIKRILIVCEKKMNCVDFHAENGELTINASSHEIGECIEKIECQSSGVADFRLNGSFFEASLAPLKKEIATMEFRGPMSPILVKEDGYLAIIMPQRK